MSRAGSSKAARDQRKQKKARRRDARKARQGARPAPPPPWAPVRDGIEGLARRSSVDFWEAARSLSERQDLPPEVWTLPRVAALSSDALVAGLAARGVPTDEATVRALGDTYRSATALLRHGLHAPQPAAALDRDFLQLATRELYRRCVPRWRCVEDIADLWVDELRRPSAGGDTLAGTEGVAEALALHLAAPGMSLAEVLYDSAPLMGWFLTLVEEAEERADEDPAGARRALPALELLAEHFAGEPNDRVDALRALGTVLRANGEDAERRLLEWSEARGSAEGAVALTEVWGAYEDDGSPEVRRAALAVLRTIGEKGWAAHEELALDERIAELERTLGA